MNKGKVCCFTGHRSINQADVSKVKKRLDDAISELIKQGVIYFGSGMARGFDILAAHAVLSKRKDDCSVKLIAVLPCINQDERWREDDRMVYRQMLAAADKVIYVSKLPYYDGCMAKRNQHLVDHSGVCVAYLKHGRSGTAQTVRLAQECGLKVINLAK